MGYRDYSTAKGHIVDATGHGDFTTIGAALTAATSGQTIFIRPGTYTENPTLVAGVNLAAYASDSQTPNVTISGNCTLSTAGTVSITGINLQTNSGNCLTVSGSAASIVNLYSCNINASNNTAISFSSSSSSAAINFWYCTGNIATTGIALFAHSSAGGMRMFSCFFNNTGSSTTANTVSGSGSWLPNYIGIGNPSTISSTATLQGSNCEFVMSGNSVPITYNSTTIGNVQFCVFTGGTSSAISIGSGATFTTIQCILSSSNTNVVTGSGTWQYDMASYNSSTGNNVTTISGLPMSIAKSGPWTPGINFGGGTTGITYAAQVGYYTQIGNIVMFQCEVALSSKGSSTGSANLTGLPVALGANGQSNSIPMGFWQGITLTSSSFTWINMQPGGTGSTTMAFQEMGSGQSGTLLTNTAFSNSSLIIFSGLYTTN